MGRRKKKLPEDDDIGLDLTEETVEEEEDQSVTKSLARSVVRALSGRDGAHASLLCDMEEEDTVVTRPRFLSTQHIGLDAILGGGIPSGRMVELYSKEEGMAKSSIVAHIMAEMTRQGGLVILFDTENGFTEDRLALFGINFENLVYIVPENIEEVFQVVEDTLELVKKKGWASKTLIVWDSVAATPSKIQFEADYGDVTVGAQARALSAGFQKLNQTLAQHECYFIAVNQSRSKIGVAYGDNTTTPGGKALKFYSGVRIELSRGASSWIKQDKNILGFIVTARTVKNKLVRPFQKADLYFFFDKGVDLYRGLFTFLEDTGMIVRNGAWYNLEGRVGSFQWKEFSSVVSSLSDEVQDKIIEHLKEHSITEPAITRFFKPKE